MLQQYFGIAAGLTLVLAPLSAEKICESCILRQQSHKDDLSKARYYEDSQFFNSNVREANADDAEPEDTSGITWVEQKTPKKLKKKSVPQTTPGK